jgi:hypothetical protein
MNRVRQFHALVPVAIPLLLAATATGCGGSSTPKQPAPPASTATSTPAADTTKRAGSSITVPAAGTQLKIKVLKVIDPLPAPKQTGPYAGDRVFAIALSVRKVGQQPYAGTPADEGSVQSTGGEGAPNAPFTSGRCAKLEHSIKLAPGRSASGCLAFDLLPSQNAALFHYSAGAGHPPAEWHLG